MKALGMYVFCGSMSIGVMNAGFDIDRVLEISDEMLEQNAKHFIHNYPNIPVIAPSEWDSIIYKNSLKQENYDLLYGNPPCSGISNINRNASAKNEVNKYMYNFIDMINCIEPKSFIMENAPTLISRGKTILDYMVSTLHCDYNITIIRDYAGNHKVPMKRQRTLLLGIRKDKYKGFPLYEYEKQTVNVETVLYNTNSHNINEIKNMTKVPERTCKDLEKFYSLVLPGDSIMTTLAGFNETELDKLDISDSVKKQTLKLREKILSGKGAFEKSPSRLIGTKLAPSLASVMEFIHPIEDRPLYIREYARLMGYPDDFEFVDDSKAPYIQSIAQGVPVNFAKWAANNIKDALEDNLKFVEEDSEYSVKFVNAGNPDIIKGRYYTAEDFLNTDNICK